MSKVYDHFSQETFESLLGQAEENAESDWDITHGSAKRGEEQWPL